MAENIWRPRLGAEAQRDLLDIVDWTARRFGREQAQLYRSVVLSALRELRAGPDIHGVRKRDDLAPELRMLHVARHGNRGRHFILFRGPHEEPNVIDILRILHDGMDFARHLSPEGS